MSKYIEIVDFIEKNNIQFFSDLLDYAAANRLDWFMILCSENGCAFFSYYLFGKENEV